MSVKEKNKIVVIGNPITQGSSEAFLRKFIEVQYALGVKITILTSAMDKSLCKPIVEVVDLSLDTRGKTKWFRWIPMSIYIVAQIKTSLYVFKERSSIAEVFCLATPHFVPVILARLLKKPVFLFAAQNPFTSAGGSLFKMLMKQLYRSACALAMLFASRIVVESASVKSALPKVVPGEKVYIAPVFVPETFRVLTPFREREPVIGYVGAITERKGVLEFARAMGKVLNERADIKLFIIGEGPCYDIVKRMLRDQGVLRKTMLKGWVEYSELPRYLNQLKLLVLPSYSEGLPNIVLEAMACGTPVLASPVGAIPDVIKDGKNGFILPSHSPEDIAKAILQIIERDDLETISQRAQKTIENGFRFKDAVKRYKCLYEKIGL